MLYTQIITYTYMDVDMNEYIYVCAYKDKSVNKGIMEWVEWVEWDGGSGGGTSVSMVSHRTCTFTRSYILIQQLRPAHRQESERGKRGE